MAFMILHKLVPKIFVALLALGVAECRQLPSSHAASHEQWMSLMNGRAYKDDAEKERRHEIFKSNLEFVNKFNSQANKTFKLSTNSYADLTNEEFQRIRTGGFEIANRSRSSSDQSKFPFLYQSLNSVPSSIDWRQSGAVTPIRNQGQCSSCWAFAAVAALEGITKIRTGKLPYLSEQQLIDCVTGGVTHGCKGGNQDDVFRYVIQNGGITSSSNYQYTGKDGYCVRNRASQYAAKIRGFANVPENNEAALLNAVSQQPVAVFVDSSSPEFRFYSSGVFSGNCGTKLDHVVAIVGYGTAQDGTRYWLVKNSWGTGWGENGYMRIQRNSGSPQGKCGIAMYASYPTA